MNNVNIDVIRTSLDFGNHSGKHICINAVIIYPPKMPAEILANRCEGDLVKYFEFAGIF